MRRAVEKAVASGRRLLGGRSLRGPSPFASLHYQRHNQRRQEHLATLGLPLHGRSVLELGAGIGDHTSYFVDRDCRVTTSDARAENLLVLRQRFPELQVQLVDLDGTPTDFPERFEVVYCYGLLYHLGRPSEAIAYMARQCSDLLLLETCVSFGVERRVHLCAEDASDITQAAHGTGCRPTRTWVFDELKQHFVHVYTSRTQPNHPEFPLDWRAAPEQRGDLLSRAVFVASRCEIDNPQLVGRLEDIQLRSA